MRELGLCFPRVIEVLERGHENCACCAFQNRRGAVRAEPGRSCRTVTNGRGRTRARCSDRRPSPLANGVPSARDCFERRERPPEDDWPGVRRQSEREQQSALRSREQRDNDQCGNAPDCAASAGETCRTETTPSTPSAGMYQGELDRSSPICTTYARMPRTAKPRPSRRKRRPRK